MGETVKDSSDRRRLVSYSTAKEIGISPVIPLEWMGERKSKHTGSMP